MVLTVIINNFSMLLPTAVSAAFLNESFGLFKVVGTVLALVSLVLSVSPDSTEENLTKKSNNAIWLICTLLVFLSNGFISINQKLYSVFTDKIEVFEFVAAAYLTASFLSAMILTAVNIKNHVRASADKKTVISSVIVGVMLGFFNASIHIQPPFCPVRFCTLHITAVFPCCVPPLALLYFAKSLPKNRG